MQYQQILLFIDISVIVLILTFFKDYYWRKILIIGTVCAYGLAAILPYLLACTSLNQTILFYVVAMGAILLLGYDQYKSMESRTNNGAVTEAVSEGKEDIPVDGDSVVQSEKQAAESKVTADNDSMVGDEPVTEYSVAEVSNVDETIAGLKTGPEDKAEDTGAGEIPSASDAAPVNTTELQDSSGNDQLAVTAEEQSTVAVVEPSTVKAEEHLTVAANEQSAVTAEEPPAVGTEEKRTAATEESQTAIDGEQPAVSDEVPLANIVEEPVTVTADDEPPAVIADEQPTVGDETPLSVAADTVTAEDKPTDDQAIEKPGKPWGSLKLESEATVIEAVTEDIEDPKAGEAVTAGVEVGIEDLIIKSFEARARGDYVDTLTILETILEQDPPEEMVNLILDDVEVLFAKLAP